MHRKSWCIGFAVLVAIQSFHSCHASSEDRSNNSQDRNDNQWGDNNDAADQWEDYYNADEVDQKDDDDWYFDDPYAPNDDAVLAKLKAQYNKYKQEEEILREERKEYNIRLLTAGSVALFGIVMATFCTSVSLYYAKKTALMLKYENEGVVVEAKILASDPSIVTNVHDKSSSGKSKILIKRSSDGNSDQATHDSYSILTDDDDASYQNNLNASYSSLKGSSSSDSADAAHEDSQQDHCNNITTPRHSNTKPAAEKKQGNEEFESIWKTAGYEEPPISPTQRFAVVVEYKDIDYDITSRIRKRFVVLGSDIQISLSNSSREMMNHKVRMYVLKGNPKSGQSCGEIHRALSWKKQLSFFFLLSFCAALMVVAVLTTSKMLSQTLFWVYLGFLLVLMSLQILVLDGAFTNIISKQYLENGRDLPLGTSNLRTNPSFDRNEMSETLKHGFSFV